VGSRGEKIENRFFFLTLMKNMFGSVVAGAFQITFRAKMHAMIFFLFLKNYF